jgi:hypothetical protein
MRNEKESIMKTDLYKDIHKAVRSNLFDIVFKAGRVDFDDSGAVLLYRAELKNTFEFLHSHASHENEFLGPVVNDVAPELNYLVGAAHDDQETVIAGLMSQFDAIDTNSESAPVEGQAFVVALSRFIGELLIHMADEEDLIMRTLEKRVPAAELIAVHQRILASIPPSEMALVLTWMLPALNAPERLGLMQGIRATAPAPAFEMIRGLASNVLSSADDAVLEEGLNGSMAA